MRNKTILGALLLLAVSTGQALSQATGQADSQMPAPPPTFAEARELAAKGRLDQALEALQKLAKVVPEEAGVERLLGMVLYQREQLQEAEATFARAIAQDSGDKASQEMRGITLYRLGRPAEAIPLLEGALGLDTAKPRSENPEQRPENPNLGHPVGANVEPQYVLGLCYADARRYDDARHAFAQQFGFGADTAEAYLITARMLLRREFADQAAVFASKAVELNPSLPLAHQLLGEIALAKADLPEAVKNLEAERKINPLNGALYDRLGDAYVRNGQFEEARTALNKAVLLEPNTTGPYILLGEALVKLGEPTQALHYLVRAETMDPNNAVTHNMLGQAYRALGRMADANREYKLSVEIQHRNDPKPGAKPSGAQ